MLEHTSMMAHTISKARIKQISSVMTFLDFKNVFREVHRKLISEVLCYHHSPQQAQGLISSFYHKFHTSSISDEYTIPTIPVLIGVLQGDCLNPLLFNMCSNKFI